MRATEFVTEDRVGKISKRLDIGTVGLHKFRDAQFADRTYELNRIMMAVASTDGTFVPELDGESWAGRNNIAAPYTPEEQEMLKMAYKAIGSHHEDLNHGDLHSQEHPAVNITSPVTAFKGYPR
tara:strand:- start:170 stop:541 length:372 start_codon:yes stop_codon:yes gene_type:complete